MFLFHFLFPFNNFFSFHFVLRYIYTRTICRFFRNNNWIVIAKDLQFFVCTSSNLFLLNYSKKKTSISSVCCKLKHRHRWSMWMIVSSDVSRRKKMCLKFSMAKCFHRLNNETKTIQTRDENQWCGIQSAETIKCVIEMSLYVSRI